MNLTVNGKGIDMGEALRTHVADSLDRVLEKYFTNPIDATATFSKQGHLFKVQISVHVSRGILMQADGEGADPYLAFDGAAETVSRRLRRHKQRLRDHHREPTDSYAAKYSVLADAESEASPQDAAEAAAPAVIAEMAADIPTLTVSQAVMRLDLAGLSAMMFHNRAHGGLNMVYRRSDGNIGWVDPALKPGTEPLPSNVQSLGRR
jgi:ribosomal subunit interface protein